MKHILLLCLICLTLKGQAQNVTPQKNDGSTFSLTSANLYFEIDSAKAARVTSFKLDGSEILYLDFAATDNAGSTFWPSPQSVWNWPPPTNLNNAPFKSTIIGNKIIFKGSIDSKTQLRFYKTIYASPSDTSIIIEYTIKNEKSSAQTWAPWEVTRVIANGISLFAKGDNKPSGNMSSNTKELENCIWYDQDKTTSSNSKNKFFCDGKGWLAHVIGGNKLFIKKFDNIAATNAAPGEAEIEVYTAPEHTYTELENQGAYVSIASKDSVTWTVKWYARTLPASVVASVGSTSLIDYITKTIGESSITSSTFKPFNNSVKVYPNPASGILFIETSIASFNDVSLNIFDMQGKTVLKQSINNVQELVNIEKLIQGNYIYELKQGFNSIAHGQFSLLR